MAKNNNKKAQAKVSKKGKVNWGVLRDAAHKEVMDVIVQWKASRDQMAIDMASKKAEIDALRKEERYKGHLIDGQWILDNPGEKHNANAVDAQAEYNEKENAILIRYKELTKEHRSDITGLYKTIGLDKHLFETYKAYIEVDSGEEERSAYLKEMEAFLKLGLKVPFGEQGLKYASYELVKGIGKRFNGIGAAYRKDRDAEAFKKSAFQDAVVANLRSILQDKGIIAINPIEADKESKVGSKKLKNKKKDPETVGDIKELADLTVENKEKEIPNVKPAVTIKEELPKADAKIKNRNRGVKAAKSAKPAKKTAKKNSKKESVVA